MGALILGVVAAAGAVAAETAPPAPDFADSLAGGPDFWAVAGLAADGRLNLRAEPVTGEVIAWLPEGTVLHNLGCRIAEGQRWCRVRERDGAHREGWASGRYLREHAG
ncbi:MAG: SH3 domain-containing protein [Amaricoccus sp.]